MREILFRAFNIYTNKFIFGSYVNKDYICKINENGKVEFFKIVKKTLGQYTGLTDDNGKKIFEGDTVKVNNVANAKVIYDDDISSFVFDYEDGYEPMSVKSIEIIGNIYDNHKLLKE